MICKIADLVLQIPEEGGIAPLLEEYRIVPNVQADVVIDASRYRKNMWQGMSPENYIYMETGAHFAYHLLRFDGLVLHASAVALDGRAYLFSAPSGTGKSTHTRLWCREYPSAKVFNDDKPALRRLDGKWYAYGTPWCGKDHQNINLKTPLAGICFLKRGAENHIRRLTPPEAVTRLIRQTMHEFDTEMETDWMLSVVERLVREIPIWELCATMEPSAAHISLDTMRRGAEENGL